MSALTRLQQAVQSFVLDADVRAATEVVSTDVLTAIARLEIYSDAYRLRLLEALASNFPRLKQLLGDRQFEALARSYIDVQRSSEPSIRWYGHRLASFIASCRPNEPWLADLAQLEWAVAAAFDARDGDTIDASSLATLQPEQWSNLRLVFNPSMQRLDLSSNAVALFKDLTEERTPPAPQTTQATSAWLVWRQDLKTQYRSLPTDEAAVLDLMRAEGSFADACELLCDWYEAEQVPLRAATHMQRWFHDQLICAIER